MHKKADVSTNQSAMRQHELVGMHSARLAVRHTLDELEANLFDAIRAQRRGVLQPHLVVPDVRDETRGHRCVVAAKRMLDALQRFAGAARRIARRVSSTRTAERANATHASRNAIATKAQPTTTVARITGITYNKRVVINQIKNTSACLHRVYLVHHHVMHLFSKVDCKRC